MYVAASNTHRVGTSSEVMVADYGYCVRLRRCGFREHIVYRTYRARTKESICLPKIR